MEQPSPPTVKQEPPDSTQPPPAFSSKITQKRPAATGQVVESPGGQLPAGLKREGSTENQPPVSKRQRTTECGANDSVSLPLGQRLQVQWDVHGDDGVVTPHWWPATYGGHVEPPVWKEGQRVSVLHYEAMGAFVPCDSQTVFLTPRVCLDVGEEDTLFWRMDGDEWAPPMGLTVDAYEDSFLNKSVLTAKELVEDQAKIDRAEHMGVPLEALAMAALQQKPMAQQLAVAGSYRTLADKIKEELRGLVKTHGPGYTVTKDDINEILEKCGKND
jgi:hypothetical protein